MSRELLRNSELTNQLTWTANSKPQYHGAEGTDETQKSQRSQGTQDLKEPMKFENAVEPNHFKEHSELWNINKSKKVKDFN